MDECPHCWNVGSNLTKTETQHHYITECPFCGTVIMTPKSTFTGERDFHGGRCDGCGEFTDDLEIVPSTSIYRPENEAICKRCLVKREEVGKE